MRSWVQLTFIRVECEDRGVSCQLLYTTVLHLERMDDVTCTVPKLVCESGEAQQCGAIVLLLKMLKNLHFTFLTGDTKKCIILKKRISEAL